MDEQEVAAGAIVAAVLGGSADPRDVAGAPSRTHDFDILLPDGRKVALEVTTGASQEAIELLAAAIGRRWEVPGCSNDWALSIDAGSGTNIRRLMDAVRPVLPILETHGLDSLRLDSNPRYRPPSSLVPEIASAEQDLFDLGVRSLTALGPRRLDVAEVFFMVGGGAASDFGRMNEVVAREADANAEKLNAALGDERHLFIWLNPSEADAELAFSTLPPPDATPELPAGIDAVWLAGMGWGGATPGHGSIGLGRLLRFRPDSGLGWEVLDPSVAP